MTSIVKYETIKWLVELTNSSYGWINKKNLKLNLYEKVTYKILFIIHLNFKILNFTFLKWIEFYK